MRTKTFIDGFKNSQRIRVMVNGVGFYTTVYGTTDMCTRPHRMAVHMALQRLAYDRHVAVARNEKEMPQGIGFNYGYFENPNMINGTPDQMIDVQVDLV